MGIQWLRTTLCRTPGNRDWFAMQGDKTCQAKQVGYFVLYSNTFNWDSPAAFFPSTSARTHKQNKLTIIRRMIYFSTNAVALQMTQNKTNQIMLFLNSCRSEHCFLAPSSKEGCRKSVLGVWLWQSLWLCSAQLLKQELAKCTSSFKLAGSPPP